MTTVVVVEADSDSQQKVNMSGRPASHSPTWETAGARAKEAGRGVEAALREDELQAREKDVENSQKGHR